MTFVAVLWLALLHALSLAAPPWHQGDAATSRHARVAQLATQRRVAPRPAIAPEESLRAPRVVATTAISRAIGPAPFGTPPHALARPSWPVPATSEARGTIRRFDVASREIAARDRLLPYFPTAPPRLG